MQKFIDFIFFEVWCKAPIGLVFDLDMFEKEPDLKAILSSFGFASNAPERGKQFYKDIKAIYELFAPLPPFQIDKFKKWYQANNDIEKVCANAPAVQIVRYADIAVNHPELSQKLASFFKGLYSRDLLSLTALRQKIGTIDDHYSKFLTFNNMEKGGKCPFCGIEKIKGINEKGREAYDHFLPKALYPFNSINFRNLVPICHECNSTYKLSKDPAYAAANRRKIFYPYADNSQSIDIAMELSKSDIDRLLPGDIELSFGPYTLSEEIETWKDIYGIEERYKAKCCSNDAIDWLEQVRILCEDDNKTPEDAIAMVRQQSKKDPIANSNFLKIAFLEGCYRLGIFLADS